jgi:hypothetical protein
MNGEGKFTVYITKHALTKGVYQFEAVHSNVENLVRGATPKTQYENFFLGKDCFLTLKEANVEAKKTRLSRIASLKKQLQKLEATNFIDKVGKHAFHQ